MSDTPERARWLDQPHERRRVQRLADVARNALPDHVSYRTFRFGLARGCKLPVNPRQNLRTWLGFYEIEIARWVRRFTRDDEVSYDVGAREGYYTVALASLAPHGHVFAIEPDVDGVAMLRETLRQNAGLGERITVINEALSDGETEGTTMDVLARTYRPPTLIKMDVDGGEFAILSTAPEVLQVAKPAIVLETHGYALEAHCLSLLADLGYRYRVINSQRLLPERRPLEVNRWVLAAHRGDERSMTL